MTFVNKRKDVTLKVFGKYGAIPFEVGDSRTKEEIEESAIWQNITENEIFQLNSAIPKLLFSPIEPHSLIALSGLSGAWIDGKTHRHLYSFAKAKTPFTTCSFKKDGVLIGLGREDGTVDLYPTSNHQTLLRRYKLNSGIIFSISFSPFANQIVVGCGNGTIFVIEISSRTEMRSIKVHDDSVSEVLPLDSGNLWITSSHDKFIRVWNLNSDEKLSEIEANGSITHMVLKGNRAFASYGNSILVVDIKSELVAVADIQAHTRPIVGLTIVRSNLVTASADRTIKIFDPSSFTLLHTIKLSNDITAFDALPDASAIAIALTGGIVQLKYIDPEKKQIENEADPSLEMPLNFRVFGSQSTTDEHHNQIKKKWNVELRKFNVSQALDLVLKEKDPPLIVGMIDELDRLGYLNQAIADRNNETLKPLLQFLVENAINPIWSHVVLKAVISVETIYRPVIVDDPQIGKMFDQLINLIREELKVQLRASKLVGKIDLILNKED